MHHHGQLLGSTASHTQQDIRFAWISFGAHPAGFHALCVSGVVHVDLWHNDLGASGAWPFRALQPSGGYSIGFCFCVVGGLVAVICEGNMVVNIDGVDGNWSNS
jgi:hypothetical protein